MTDNLKVRTMGARYSVYTRFRFFLFLFIFLKEHGFFAYLTHIIFFQNLALILTETLTVDISSNVADSIQCLYLFYLTNGAGCNALVSVEFDS